MGKGEKDLVDYLAAHGGVITRAEALALGVASATLTRRVAANYLVKVGRGLYIQPGILASEETLLRAATRALGAVASHESAARLHGLHGLRSNQVTVSVPIRRSNKFEGVIVHQSTDLSEDEVVDIRGIPTADPVRTIIDLAAVLPLDKLAEIVDQAVRKRLTTYEAISRRLEATARRGKPGVVKLRSILEIRLGGPFVSDSTLETRLLSLLERAGLPRPITQFRAPWLKRINGRVDFAYRREQILIEADGYRWHGSPRAFQTDRYRDNVGQLAGWIVLRFTWADLTERPSYITSSVRLALRERNSNEAS